jgi:hypothetical protein
MIVRFKMNNVETGRVECEIDAVPQYDNMVQLSFAGREPKHLYRVLSVRWYLMEDPPYAEVRVTAR